MGIVAAMAATQTEVAMALTQRLSPRLAQKVTYEQLPADTCDYFTLRNAGDKVLIGGNNANAMAVGLNHYLKNCCLTTVSWYADVPVELPSVLPPVDSAVTVRARVPQRFFLN